MHEIEGTEANALGKVTTAFFNMKSVVLQNKHHDNPFDLLSALHKAGHEKSAGRDLQNSMVLRRKTRHHKDAPSNRYSI